MGICCLMVGMCLVYCIPFSGCAGADRQRLVLEQATAAALLWRRLDLYAGFALFWTQIDLALKPIFTAALQCLACPQPSLQSAVFIPMGNVPREGCSFHFYSVCASVHRKSTVYVYRLDCYSYSPTGQCPSQFFPYDKH